MILKKILVTAIWLFGNSITFAAELVDTVRESKAEYFLCVDGGGTHTSFSLLDKKGQLMELGYVSVGTAAVLQLPPSNVTLIGPKGVGNLFESFFKNCQVKIDEKWVNINTLLCQCFIYAGFAGAGTIEIQQQVAAAIRSTRPLHSVQLTYVTSDINLFKNVAPQGIFLSVGTGSIGFWKFNGKEGRAGGDHWLLRSDKGSSVHIGQLAIEKALRIERKHLMPTIKDEFPEDHQANFKKAILSYKPYKELSPATVMQLSRNILADLKALKVEKLTCLAPLIFELGYKHNNAVALSILKKAARSLRKIIDQSIWNMRQTQNESFLVPAPFPLYLSGGIFKNQYLPQLIKDMGLDESQFSIHNFSKRNIAVEGLRTALKSAFSYS